MVLQISSTAFHDGEYVPRKFTCDGEDISPQLTWTGAPSTAQTLVLIVDDPDAPKGTWVHWVLFNIDAKLDELPEGATGIGVEGKNSWHRTGYGGPCPPPGQPHRYIFNLYAMDMRLDLQVGASKVEIEKAMQGHILAQAQIVGNYGR